MKKVELLAPAGDLEKLKLALLYGADAVFCGGFKFSLRAKASNLSDKELKEAVEFAHGLNKKIHVTVNVILEDGENEELNKYLSYLDSINVDAVIVSSLAAMEYVRKHTSMEIHVSTQCSVSNVGAINFYESLGAKRIVLARECSIAEISKIRSKTPLELEVFIHGGLCSAISGRCHLSDYYTNRKANRGACAHSCRWDYKFLDSKLPFQFGCKDLCTLEYIKDLIDIGVSSFKIEGRMKSIHYIATVIRAYRKCIDAVYNGTYSLEVIEECYQELAHAESRDYGSSFIKGYVTRDDMAYSYESKTANNEFAGYIIPKNGRLLLVPKSLMYLNDEYELLTPGIEKSEKIRLINMEEKDTRHVDYSVKAEFDKEVKPYCILRNTPKKILKKTTKKILED